jgi:hypothetical protein
MQQHLLMPFNGCLSESGKKCLEGGFCCCVIVANVTVERNLTKILRDFLPMS